MGNHTFRPIFNILMPYHRSKHFRNSQNTAHPGIAVGIYEIKTSSHKDLGEIMKPDPHPEKEKAKERQPIADTATAGADWAAE
ncbi:MAG: hypothetical protein DVB28_000176 [Verrucomicrobia bacterium]|nr:MAG: hypothetical protein DVB28_000176 [Verrucomicrobiota bacterium]